MVTSDIIIQYLLKVCVTLTIHKEEITLDNVLK